MRADSLHFATRRNTVRTPQTYRPDPRTHRKPLECRFMREMPENIKSHRPIMLRERASIMNIGIEYRYGSESTFVRFVFESIHSQQEEKEIS
ncbi:hypothetical protein NOF55_20540 [Rhizobiaceae bacterium BDR2-2]|uniref:Uncharacterized protein n=1 Tax=Ectorhizobium quercum TaxID=2965071 RepID=A0AAE3N6L7_9HYPH|nr:hypothetical protein [Ectorhizobium quercum]MCX8999497.1 hypothetical protein [Ectorhizobium quercum]